MSCRSWRRRLRAISASVLILFFGETPRNFATSSIVFMSRRVDFERLAVAFGREIFDTAASFDVAFSRFAAYLHFSQLTIWSSPAGVRTMNSCDCDPPMAPESASTTMYFKPQRSKMRQ